MAGILWRTASISWGDWMRNKPLTFSWCRGLTFTNNYKPPSLSHQHLGGWQEKNQDGGTPRMQVIFCDWWFFFFNFFFNVVNGGWGLLYANTGGRGYTLCELPQAKPKIAQILPSLNFKASHFSPVVTGWGQAAWVVPLPKHSPSQGTTTHASQKTQLINTPCLPLTAHPATWGKSTISKPTMLAQGSTFPQ